MSITYNITTNFGAKDTLPANDPSKVIRGLDFTTEFEAIKTAFSSAAPAASPVITGTANIPLINNATGVALQYNGSTVLSTVSGGVSVTGTGTFSGEITANAGIALPDNQKATFGASDDLQIYHDGSHSIIADVGTGDLKMKGSYYNIRNSSDTETLLSLAENGAVTAYYDGASKLATTSTGVDVTGTVTADGLNIGTPNDLNSAQVSVAAADNAFIEVENKTTQLTAGFMWTNSGSKKWTLEKTGTSHNLFLQNSADTTSVQFHQNNDISFYESTGTTAKFFWDASAEALGIGQGVYSTTHALNLKGEGLAIKNDKNGSDNNWSTINNTDTGSSSNLSFSTGGKVDAVVFSHAGNVGIGTSSPSNKLHVEGAQNSTVLRLTDTSELGHRQFAITSSSNGQVWNLNSQGDSGGVNAQMTFSTKGTERMRLDSSGNVGIGVTPPSHGSNITSLDIAGTGIQGSLLATDSGTLQLAHNYYYNGTNDTYVATGTASRYYQFQGEHIWNTAASGTAGTTISFSESMRIDSSGNLLVGKTSDSLGVAGAKLGTGGSNFTRDGAEVLYVNRLTSEGTLITLAKDTTPKGYIGTLGGAGEVYIAGGSGTSSGVACTNNNAIAPMQATALSDNTQSVGTASYRWTVVYATTGTINTSDRNTKQNIRDLTDAEQRVAVACKGLMKAYRFKDAVANKGDDARIHFGIIAQDLQAAFEAEGLDASNYACFCSDTWTDEETGQEVTRLGVRYEELLAFIIAAL